MICSVGGFMGGGRGDGGFLWGGERDGMDLLP